MTEPRMTPTNDAPVTVEREAEGGPRVTIKATCYGCRYERSVRYRCQGDSGHDSYCDHPTSGGKKIGDTRWDTPDWCPVVDMPAIRDARHRLGARASAPAVLLYPADGENFGKWHMMLLRLINAVHRDNGEKTQAIGIEPAFEQALEIVRAPRTPPVPTAAGTKPPSPPGYSLADMKRWHHLGHDDDGIPCD